MDLNIPFDPQVLLCRLSQQQRDTYDWILAGDGSGNLAENPCGWACFGFRRGAEDSPILWCGGNNGGTNNLAEISAYMAPLTHIEAGRPEGQPVKVHVFTDSEYVRTIGTVSNKGGQPDKNCLLWAVFKVLRSRGVTVEWHYIPRNSNAYMEAADDVAGRMRRIVRDGDPAGSKAADEATAGGTADVGGEDAV